MIYAVIFAGGTGVRMKTKGIPKQFLKIYGIPIIIHTLLVFENCDEVNEISIACLEEYIPTLNNLLEDYRITKVKWVVPGGIYGQRSRWNAMDVIVKEKGIQNEDIVLIHDGVRPIITARTLLDNINCVKKHGNAITAVKSVETGVLSDDSKSVSKILDRDTLFTAKAPQSFYLRDIYAIYKKAYEAGIEDSIDSCCLASHFGTKIHFVEGERSNIKITTTEDYYMLKALFELREDEQIMGL